VLVAQTATPVNAATAEYLRVYPTIAALTIGTPLVGTLAVVGIIYGAIAFASFLGKTPGRAFAYRKFVEGLGKLLWFPMIKPRFYGAATLKAKVA
jgi:hypothetical protein